VGTLRIFSQDEWTEAPPASAVPLAIAEGVRAAGDLLPPGVAVRLDVVPDLPPVSVGEAILTQVVIGLLLSAGDGARGARQVTVEARQAAASVRIDVLDDGRGLTSEELARLFDDAGASWAPGRGVGLGLARELLGLEGGRLEVANRAEGGARHRLWLPGVPAGTIAPAPAPC
jgi:C4-dicarboxylate-specific signal transduction histidine kinase